MKRIFLILAAILILLKGCNNSTELSDTPTESTPAIVITETVTTPTTENEDPKRTTDNADAASSFSASKETVTTEPEETISETKPSPSSSPMLPFAWRVRLSFLHVSSFRCLPHHRQRLTPMLRRYLWCGVISENLSLICLCL